MKLEKPLSKYLIYLYLIVLPLIPSQCTIYDIPFKSEFLLALFFVLYLIESLINKNIKLPTFLKEKKYNLSDLLILTLLGIMVISILYALNKKSAIGETLRFFSYVLLYFIIKHDYNDGKFTKNTIKCFFTTCTIVALVGIFQYLTKSGQLQNTGSGVVMKIASTMDNPISFGGFMLFAFFPALVLSLYEKKLVNKIIYINLSILFLIGAVLSSSRNVLIGLIVGVILLILIYNIKYIFVLVGMIGGTLLFPKVYYRLREVIDVSQNQSRLEIWKTTWNIIKNHPFLGVGNGNFTDFFRIAYKEQYSKELQYIVVSPHNVFLKIQCELGIVGLAVFLILIIMMIIKCKKSSGLVKNEFHQHFYKGFLISFICLIFMNLFDNFFVVPKFITYFWILLAIFESIITKENMNIITKENVN